MKKLFMLSVVAALSLGKTVSANEPPPSSLGKAIVSCRSQTPAGGLAWSIIVYREQVPPGLPKWPTLTAVVFDESSRESRQRGSYSVQYNNIETYPTTNEYIDGAGNFHLDFSDSGGKGRFSATLAGGEKVSQEIRCGKIPQ